MAMIHISRSGNTLGVFEEAKVREGLKTGEFIETDLGWMEGMPTWRPLSEIDTFAAQAAGASQQSPATSPASGGGDASSGPAPFATPGPGAAPTVTGLPWENRESIGFIQAMLATIAMVLTRPGEAFTVMRKEGNLLDPLLYTVILGSIGAVVSWLYSLITNAIGLTGAGEGALHFLGTGAGGFFLVVMSPVIIVIVTFIAAGLFHVGLMLFGGAKQPFETTVRVVAFGGGSANVFQLVPVCGGLIVFVYSVVLYCIGLSRAHNTDTGRAVGAVLLPLVICCGGFFVLMMMVGGLAAMANR